MNIRFVPAAAGLALLLAGCGAASPPAQPPLAGARIGGPFALIDEAGRARTDQDFAGQWRVMYFGYTFCPDVCPTGAQNIAAGLKRFEGDDPGRGGRVTPVFVTIDPARDTPAALKSFTAAFHPRMVGLTGTEEAIAAVAKSYGAYRAKGDVSPGGGYLMDHSDQAYLMDPQGKPIALIPHEQGSAAVAAELARWVK
ncbi:SCO family protein [uncultured Sphingomonas sp.]|uniref:SCO family protein n=1 Tax=uncultured Sphingomonas sp. TaxID=158754 RepID=UPI0035C9FE5F